MSDNNTIGGRVLAVLGSVAALITIGGLGHCVGVHSSSARIEQLEEQLRLVSSSGAGLEKCSGDLTSCQQAGDELKRELTDLRRRLARDSGVTDANDDATRTSPGSPATTNQVEAPGLRVQLSGCSLQRDELACTFTATSTDRDKTVYLRSSRLIESDGSEVRPIRMQFASSVSSGNHSPGTGKQVYAEMVRAAPIRGGVTFAGVNPALAGGGIPLIEFKFDGLAAQFRDVRPE